MRKLFAIICGGVRFDSVATDIAVAAPRILCGILLPLNFGLSKFPPPQWFIEDVGRLGFPAPAAFAWAAVLTEVFGSFALALGLFTRLFAALLIVTMFVAAFVQKADAHLFERLPALFFMLNAWFALALGSTRIGLDELIRRKLLKAA